MDAYDLIMKNKELLLDRNPKKSPVRFIFSHSALREGWDNPNVFQICTLKQSSSEVRKRQEVGRGLRLCVNQDGERMDSAVLGKDVHNINILTVIASESYDSFAKGLQSEMAEAVADRPRAVTVELFQGKVIQDDRGNEMTIDMETARAIHTDLLINGYIDRKYALTDKYYEAKANVDIQIAEEVADCRQAVIDILDEHYETDIFTDPAIKGKLGINAMKAKKHLYDHIVYDSTNERDFAEQLDTDTSVAVYVKLPDGFYISTPVGHYNPDWAIAFYEGSVKHIYFVAETKGSMSSMQLREIEKSKIHCAEEHFKAISNGDVVYSVVDSYQSLLDLVRK